MKSPQPLDPNVCSLSNGMAFEIQDQDSFEQKYLWI